ncbi:MAG: class I SAM-dependent methyltransferase [Ilumatobacteraceae bacterium]
MPESQEKYPHDLAEMAQWVSSFAGPGMRVLEIGCGDGALTARLAAAGMDVLGVDPNATEDARVRAIKVEDLDAEPFDVVFASVSLHHLDDAARTSAALRRLTKRGTIALVREFDKTVLDEPTLRWWFHQLHAERATTKWSPDHADETEHDNLAGDFDEFVIGWRRTMDHHVHAWAIVARFLEDAGFDTQQLRNEPYLFRWGLPEAVRPLEQQLINDARIKPVGVRWHGQRMT